MSVIGFKVAFSLNEESKKVDFSYWLRVWLKLEEKIYISSQF